jgi:hypothetical protein
MQITSNQAVKVWTKYYSQTANILRIYSNNDHNYRAFLRQTLHTEGTNTPEKSYLKPSHALRIRLGQKYSYKSRPAFVSEVYSNSNYYMNILVENFNYLLAYHNISATQACKELRQQGINVTPTTLQDMQRIACKFNPVYMFALCLYFGEPFERMISQNYAANKLKPLKTQPIRSLYLDNNTTPTQLRQIYKLGSPKLPDNQ